MTHTALPADVACIQSEGPESSCCLQGRAPMLSDQLIWYDDAAYYISFRQHSETDLVTGHVSLAHHLQHGRLDKLPLSINDLSTSWTHYTCKADFVLLPLPSIIACGSRHLAASFRSHVTSAMQHHHLVPQLHPSCMVRVHARGHADQYESCCADVLLRSPMHKQSHGHAYRK